MHKLQPGQWCKRYAACRKCHGTDRPHFGQGLCRRCYLARYNKRNADKVYKLRDRWYRRNITPEIQRIAREQRHYAGMRQAALERDGNRCTICGTPEKLTVHHIDRQGRGKPNPNNDLANLQTLCRKHHIEAHREQLRIAFRNHYQRKQKIGL